MTLASTRSPIPDIANLPDEALLTRKQVAAAAGYAYITLKKWAREGRGPKIIYVEGRPRTKVCDYKAWIAASSRAA